MGSWNVIQELSQHLIDSGYTYSTEANDPAYLKPVAVEVLLRECLDYLTGAGYVNSTKTTV
jgi:hypothetical protein